MEKTQEQNRERVLKEIASSQVTAFNYILTLHSALKAANEVLYDLTWGKGGSLDPLNEQYTSELVKIINRILED